MYVCMNECMYGFTISTYVCMLFCKIVSNYLDVIMYVCTYVCIYVCMYVCMYVPGLLYCSAVWTSSGCVCMCSVKTRWSECMYGNASKVLLCSDCPSIVSARYS